MATKLLTINEVADMFGVHHNTVRIWISEGRLPAQRLGARAIRIRLTDAEAMIRPIGAS